MKKGFTLTAERLRIILAVLLVLVLVGGGIGFTYVQRLLGQYVADTNALNTKADLSSTNLQTLQKLQEYLAAHQDDVDLAKQVVAESKSYQYQNEIINDLTNFAQKSGVTITQFDFSSTSQESSGTPATAPPATGSSTTTAPSSGTTGTSAPAASLNSKSVTITIKSPVSYNSLLEFMHRIEQNVTKMQIEQVSLSSDQAGSSKVAAQSFTIQVYVQ